MRRRSFLALGSAGLALAQKRTQRAPIIDCGCGFAPQQGGRGAGLGQASLAGFERLRLAGPSAVWRCALSLQ